MKKSEVVLARRLKRDDGFIKNILFGCSIKFNTISQILKIQKIENYSLMSKKVIEKINNLPEVNRYINGLRAISSYNILYKCH